jgi:hypothetical protein
MNSCDVAINVQDFLHQPSAAIYSYLPQPSQQNNWLAILLKHGNIIPIIIETTPAFETAFNDSELMKMGHLSIEPLLAEDWNSPEDDVWDSV